MNAGAPPARTPTGGQTEGSGALLELIRQGRAGTVTELADAMGVARSTITQRLGLLMTLGLVSTLAPGPTGARGRPAMVTRFDPTAAVVVGAHIGLTGYKIVVTDLAGTVLARREVDLDLAIGPVGFGAHLAATATDLHAETPLAARPVAGIGIGTPGRSQLRRISHDAESGEWDVPAFQRAMTERLGVAVRMDLDANLLALAEQRTSWPDAEVVVGVKLGSVISGALVVRGVPVRGATGLAGELGHLRVDGQDEACACGNRGCLDAVAGGRAVVRRLAERGVDIEHVGQIPAHATTDDPRVHEVLREAGRRIGEVLALATNLLNPEMITVWGYLTQSESLLAGVREGLYARALPAAGDGVRLVASTLGQHAGAQGAAMVILDAVLSPVAIDRVVQHGSWQVLTGEEPARTAG